jgi:BirA family biotin operon repressor/biotin-[acetyl-CoA-carboxylase] ligase
LASEDGAAFSVTRFQDLLTTAWLGRDCRYEPVVGSTMDVAKALTRRDGRHGTLVVADEQTEGKGRLGRRWLTPPGRNLAVSLLLQPGLQELKTLSMIASLAVVDGVQAAAGIQCRIKWPNDVQCHGRKLAGILVDSEIAGERPGFAIAGIGINVNYDTASEPEIAALATSLMVETGRLQEREAVLAACLNAFERLYESPGAEVVAAWRAALSTLGQSVRVTSAGTVIEGDAVDVTDDGRLVVRREDGVLVCLPAGEVTLST